MSQTTCCPTCQTLFKVVPDQLRVSEGWVRCGKCSEIFDAHQHLFKEAFAPETASEIFTVIPGPADVADTKRTERVPLRGEREAGLGANAKAARNSVSLADTQQTRLSAQRDGTDLLAPAPPVPKRRSKAKAGAGMDTLEARNSTSSEVTFLNVPKGRAFWGRMWVRMSLGLMGAGLSGALALQAVVHQRDYIAATVPAAKSAVESLCQTLGCRVLPLRQIESMVIDGSTFTELRGNAYRLYFTVKNSAAVELALPAIELTLTDSQDRAALRRVFLPAEMGATSVVLGAGAEWVGSMVLSVRTNGVTERISGYRISAIYP